MNRDKTPLGINITANIETQESVPYLTHFDYEKSLAMLVEFADFIVINISRAETPGLNMYRNEESLRKFLGKLVKTKNSELGKIAALEYESVYSTSSSFDKSPVREKYSRNGLLSKLKPPSLWLKVDSDLSKEEYMAIGKVIKENKLSRYQKSLELMLLLLVAQM